jgi:hypothetical protein
MSSTSDGGAVRSRLSKIAACQWVSVAGVLAAVAALLGYSLLAQGAAVAVAADSQQRGFALPTWQEGGYDAPNLEQSLREMRGVGATWVELTVAWSQQSTSSNEVLRVPETVSDSGLQRAIALAHQQGLSVFLKPHIDLPGNSRNNIRPDDQPAWFSSYTAFITHYASLAQQSGVEQFAVGTELSSISGDRDAWLGVIDAVRAQYHGPVVYAAGRDWRSVPFWDAVDVIGIDAYPRLSDTPTSDVSVLRRAWEAYVEEGAALSARYGRKILFTEAGFTSQQGTTTDPSNWRISRTPSEAEQAAGYEALLATFSDKPWWAGVFWWEWAVPPFSEAEPLDYSPRGKAAESVIRRWWAP